ncbi:MAG: hypothetical protein ACI9D5_002302 [Candidatus Endobugula sp.]|jgi:hypothetical protein
MPLNISEAEKELLTTGSVIEFKVLEAKVEACTDGEEAHSQVILMILDEDDDKGYDAVSWGAFGFIYILASLSFDDATPRNVSEIDYKEVDYFTLENLIQSVSFTNGSLNFYCDYLRGRLVKTSIVVNQDGRVDIGTICRGNALKVWLQKLQGKKILHEV